MDLRTQLLINERKAEDKKRKARGLPALPPLVLPGQETKLIEGGGEDEQGDSKRRKLEEAVGLDRDDEDDEEDDEESGKEKDLKGKGKAKEK